MSADYGAIKKEMKLLDFFNPVRLDKPEHPYMNPRSSFSGGIDIYTPNTSIKDISQYHVAIIGLPDDRGTINEGAHEAPLKVREKLYQLASFSDSSLRIIDLGDLKKTNSINETYAGIRELFIELLQKDVIAVFIGGGQDLTYGIYKAMKFINRRINITTLDATLDLNALSDGVNSGNYLSKIFFDDQDDPVIFDYTNLGNQLFYCAKSDMKKITDQFFTSVRLGDIRSDLQESEPVLRDTSLLSVDMNVVKQADAPANKRPSPNGFNGDEICQLMRYAGLGDAIKALGLFEINPLYDQMGQTVHLAAQMIWYFIKGLEEKSLTFEDFGELKKFHVTINDSKHHEMLFLKSEKSGKWWLEVPSVKLTGPVRVACSYRDYQMACDDELPNRWWKTYQKIN